MFLLTVLLSKGCNRTVEQKDSFGSEFDRERFARRSVHQCMSCISVKMEDTVSVHTNILLGGNFYRMQNMNLINFLPKLEK